MLKTLIILKIATERFQLTRYLRGLERNAKDELQFTATTISTDHVRFLATVTHK